jgi:hypothetical protein
LYTELPNLYELKIIWKSFHNDLLCRSPPSPQRIVGTAFFSLLQLQARAPFLTAHCLSPPHCLLASSAPPTPTTSKPLLTALHCPSHLVCSHVCSFSPSPSSVLFSLTTNTLGFLKGCSQDVPEKPLAAGHCLPLYLSIEY